MMDRGRLKKVRASKVAMAQDKSMLSRAARITL
jgi:hypothetical protein